MTVHTVVRDARRLVICSILYLQSDQETAIHGVGSALHFPDLRNEKNELLV